MNFTLFINFLPTFLQPLNQRLITIISGNHLHNFLVLLMALKPGKRPIEQKGFFLIFIHKEFLLEPIINIQYMMFNGKLIPFQSLIQPIVIAFDQL